jgi:predicted transcriptional regulator
VKAQEKKLAREFRKKGWSLRAIATEVKCSKSIVSRWISDIKLTAKQIERLKSNQDRARAKIANHPNCSRRKWERIRNGIKDSSRKDIPRRFTNELLKIAGTALYWAEGYNASRAEIIFANTDPRMIKLMMLFFKRICKVPDSKFRGKVGIHPHLDIRKAEKYWSSVSGIPLRQFNKPLLAVSRASKGKRDTLPMGTFSIRMGDVYTCSRIKGWIEGLSSWPKLGG